MKRCLSPGILSFSHKEYNAMRMIYILNGLYVEYGSQFTTMTKTTSTIPVIKEIGHGANSSLGWYTYMPEFMTRQKLFEYHSLWRRGNFTMILIAYTYHCLAYRGKEIILRF